MPKFRKKPVVIEAVQWDGSHASAEEIGAWVGPDALLDRRPTGAPEGELVTTLSIRTIEGMMKAGAGDYIIKGVEGEFYPCKQGIFEKTYDPAE